MGLFGGGWVKGRNIPKGRENSLQVKEVIVGEEKEDPASSVRGDRSKNLIDTAEGGF